MRDHTPVVVCDDQLWAASVKGPILEEAYTVPLGVAAVTREGCAVTVIAIAKLVHEALAAAEALSHEGIAVDVSDPRTLTPTSSWHA
jgi:pyruvate dehydrogenase E1 component beta subunit